MPLSIPTELKKISPFIKRAEELDRDKSAAESRIVAYYCRQYAVTLGIPLSTTDTAKACLGEILAALEQEKPAMDQFTRDEAAFLCRKFAHSVFDKADQEDRNGNSNKHTAKTFYAAVSFLEILRQFDETEDEENSKKIKYSKWKATDILKAIKEGRTPTPGGFEEHADLGVDEEEEDAQAETPAPIPPPAPSANIPPPVVLPNVETVQEDQDDDEDLALPPPVSMAPLPKPAPAPTPPPPPPPAEEGTEVNLGPPPAYPTSNVETFEPETPTKKKKGIFGFGSGSSKKPSKEQINDAVELTRFALAALEDKQTDLGAQRLQQALKALGR